MLTVRRIEFLLGGDRWRGLLGKQSLFFFLGVIRVFLNVAENTKGKVKKRKRRNAVFVSMLFRHVSRKGRCLWSGLVWGPQ